MRRFLSTADASILRDFVRQHSCGRIIADGFSAALDDRNMPRQFSALVTAKSFQAAARAASASGQIEKIRIETHEHKGDFKEP